MVQTPGSRWRIRMHLDFPCKKTLLALTSRRPVSPCALISMRYLLRNPMLSALPRPVRSLGKPCGSPIKTGPLMLMRLKEAVQLFFEVLGQIAGDLAISLSTPDGAYIAGGIAKRYPQLLADSRFRSGFDNKGRHRPLMERIPTRLITHPEPGLLGASFHAIKLPRGG